MKTAIIVFHKKPVTGKVKTRLAKTIGAENARAIYTAMLSDLENSLATTPLSVYPFVNEDITWAQDFWRCRCFLQRGDTFGEKMANSFRDAFAEGEQRCILIGCDVPALDERVLMHLDSLMNSQNTLVAPTRDGGYYALGFTPEQFIPDVFSPAIPWGTASVFTETTGILHQRAVDYATGPELMDIDTEDDLRFFRKQTVPAGKNPGLMHTLEAIGYPGQGII